MSESTAHFHTPAIALTGVAFACALLFSQPATAACKNTVLAGHAALTHALAVSGATATGTHAAYFAQIERGAAAAVLRDIEGKLARGQWSSTPQLDALRAVAYSYEGDEDIARQFADHALAAKGLAPVLEAELQALTATVFLRIGLRPRGLELLNAAYLTFTQQGEALSAAVTLANFAQATRDRPAGFAAAMTLLDQREALIGTPRGIAALTIAARVAVETAEPVQAQAVRSTMAALRTLAEPRDGALAAAASHALALMDERAGNTPAARDTNQQVLDRATSARIPLKPDWLWQRARLLRQAGDVPAAREAFGDLIARLGSAKATLDPALLATGSSFRERYGEAYLQFADLLIADAKAAAPARKAALLAQVRDLTEFTKTVEAADYFRDPCIGSDAPARVVEAADRSAVTLYPIALDDRLELLAGRGDRLELVTVPVTRKELAQTVNEYRRLLEKRTTSQFLRPARRLYDWLIRPVEQRFGFAGDTTLVVVPDSMLRTMPFSALNDGERFLVEKVPVGTTISLTLTDPKRLDPTQLRSVVKGLTEARQGFSGLPAVAEEVREIGKILNTVPRLDRDFTEAAFTQDLSHSAPRVVHVASHGQFSADPRDSFLLTYDTKMNLDKLRTAIAAGSGGSQSGQRGGGALELLMLSACQTAVGDDRAAMGLAGVALRSGARSALASLWYVNDESTAELSSTFYNNLVAQRQTRAGALRQAQVSMIRSEKFSHPAYWAPFLMVGSWL
ncbi:MAG: CHAT domain-containing protein [Betaproteobacteria bacterium]|nr:CHAT domain-containing protein [Betaproteobacteria bacterium]